MLIQTKEKTNYKEDVLDEKPLRSVVKSLSWRTIGTLDTILISWLITGIQSGKQATPQRDIY